MNDFSTYKTDSPQVIETDTEQNGWGFFSEEISWFLFDFFSKRLDPMQKIVFYSYYVTGMTLNEIAERLHCTHQAIHKRIIKMNKMMSHAWQYSDRWREMQ